MRVDLSNYNNGWYKTGRGVFTRFLWYFVNALFLNNPLNFSSIIKIVLMRMFGAKIGRGVRINPSINVKYPWNIHIGDHTWIGENVWLDSLVTIKIGKNCCISQGSYLCTGNHDWRDPLFGLIVKPIIVEDGVWVGAKATVLPGVKLSDHSVLCAGAVASKDAEPFQIYAGNPAEKIKRRKIKPNPLHITRDHSFENLLHHRIFQSGLRRRHALHAPEPDQTTEAGSSGL